ncbi:pyruvate formate-lyase-activating protein [Ornithinibacillus halophilus]|uniref:Pyruvate formate-lyase-activating enzyme n=1 Tax=Ornithinibacillus halophilus TaxID=930117 RepID=A0A1M5NQV4_9BACI|nr:pyruvate formate-lyase-activating protein [Ornithinibacillus halophilus]SHG91900.1 pyruvate formate lyase activating enzyme [Ornithinibacillus halophilus]
MLKGRIHSVETCGTVDGPGIRYILFMQGCLLRCQFCHNPDTWKMGDGKEVTVEEVLQDIESYVPFFKATGGGVTVSGGEPLLHTKFLVELFKELKKRGIHTTIDTSGGCFSKSPSFMKSLDQLLSLTDLVLLDIKQIDPAKHKSLTGMSNEHILEFASYLAKKNMPVWIRHVLVPGKSDFDKDLYKLVDFIKTLPNVEKVEVLPYHKLGVYKWEALGLEYPLHGVEAPTEERVKNAERILS